MYFLENEGRIIDRFLYDENIKYFYANIFFFFIFYYEDKILFVNVDVG